MIFDDNWKSSSKKYFTMDEIISHDLKLYFNLYKEYLFSISYEIENYPYVMFRGIFSMSNTPTRHLIYFGPISLLYIHSININRSRCIYRSLSLVLNYSGLKILP